MGFDTWMGMCANGFRCGIGQINKCSVMVYGILLITVHGICNQKIQIIAEHAVGPYNVCSGVVLTKHFKEIVYSVFKAFPVFFHEASVRILVLLEGFAGFRNSEGRLIKCTCIVGSEIDHDGIRFP